MKSTDAINILVGMVFDVIIIGLAASIANIPITILGALSMLMFGLSLVSYS